MGKVDSDIESGEKYGGAPGYTDDTGAVPGESFTYGNSTYAKLQTFAGKFGVEQRGIERVPESERTDTSLRKIATLVSIRSTSSCSLPNTDILDSGAAPTW